MNNIKKEWTEGNSPNQGFEIEDVIGIDLTDSDFVQDRDYHIQQGYAQGYQGYNQGYQGCEGQSYQGLAGYSYQGYRDNEGYIHNYYGNSNPLILIDEEESFL